MNNKISLIIAFLVVSFLLLVSCSLEPGVDVSETIDQVSNAGEDAGLTRGTSIGNKLSAGMSMYVGQELSSTSGKYKAVLQNDGNFVIYRTSPWKALWAKAGTWNKPINRLYLTTSGDLRIYGDNRYLSYYRHETQYIYNSNPYSDWVSVWYDTYLETDSGILSVIGSGLTSVYLPSETRDWVSVQCPVYRDTSSYSYWRTNTSTPTGKCALYMQDDGNLVLYNTSTWAAIWASGTWEAQ